MRRPHQKIKSFEICDKCICKLFTILTMTSISKSENETASPSLPQKASKQACDNCRRRKIKCNRAHPCDKCQRLLLSCSYCDVLQRKGPKFRTIYPLAPLQTLVSQYPTPPQSITDQASQSELIVPREFNIKNSFPT